LRKEEAELVSKLMENIGKKRKINYNQFNELLLLLNEDTVGLDFFNYFFGADNISLSELKKGVMQFQGFAMLLFGNLKYAYKKLANKSTVEIERELFPYSQSTSKLIRRFLSRPDKMLEINLIGKEKTWLVGELSAGRIKNEGKVLKQLMENYRDYGFRKQDLEKFAEKLIRLDEEEKIVQELARKNTDIYLTWDYMDVYFATSMRAISEFEEVYDFINDVINNERISKMSLRYFDPTQSKCGNRIDKGMIEGLMLKRASCTVYMVQESDTLGKDSELASTLAQKKPVIAYVPNPNRDDYSKKISKYPLDFFKRRMLILQSEEIFNDPICYELLLQKNKNFEKIIKKYLNIIEEFLKKQPLRLWTESEASIKDSGDFHSLCDILAVAECFRFDKRAKMLKEIHPLAMQVDLQTGVSNGVLVVRSPKECADLLCRILTNNLSFSIKHIEYKDEVRASEEGYSLLVEEISDSPFRAITDQRRLTNSFWNLFFRNPQN